MSVKKFGYKYDVKGGRILLNETKGKRMIVVDYSGHLDTRKIDKIVTSMTISKNNNNNNNPLYLKGVD